MQGWLTGRNFLAQLSVDKKTMDTRFIYILFSFLAEHVAWRRRNSKHMQTLYGDILHKYILQPGRDFFATTLTRRSTPLIVSGGCGLPLFTLYLPLSKLSPFCTILSYPLQENRRGKNMEERLSRKRGWKMIKNILRVTAEEEKTNA